MLSQPVGAGATERRGWLGISRYFDVLGVHARRGHGDLVNSLPEMRAGGGGAPELCSAAHQGDEVMVQLAQLFWNWIGRSQEEIVQARRDWMEGPRFGEVKGSEGAPLPAPELPTTLLKPRGRVR